MAIVNINTYNDVDFYRTYVYQTQEIDTNGTTYNIPFDLTGAMLQMGVRVNASDVEEQLLLTSSNGGIIIEDAANGIFTLNITQSQLLLLPVGSYVHSLIRIYSYSDRDFRYLIWHGTLTNNAGPSR